MASRDLPDEDTDAHAIDVLLSRASKTNPCVIVVGGTSQGKVFRLGGEMIVGRGAEAHIRLEDDGVSRAHLKLKVGALNVVEATDLGSTNGTYCNGELLQTRILDAGDRLQVGPIALLKFLYQDELEEAVQAKLYENATRDPLTRAHHRKFLEEALDKDFATYARHGHPVSVVMIRIDAFEELKKREGLGATDRILQRTAMLISSLLRAEDVFARFSEDSFCVALRKTGSDEAALCAERIRSEFGTLEFVEAGKRIEVKLGIGISALGRKRYRSVTELLIAAAEASVQAAKKSDKSIFNSDVVTVPAAELAAKSKERRGHVRLAVPLNARILKEGQEVEYQVRDVSLGGIYLFANATPESVGGAVALKLAITAGIRPLRLEAEIVRVSSDEKGGVRGVALEFANMDGPKSTQLLDLLDRAMAGRGTMTRAFPRLYPLIEAQCRAGAEFKAVVRDIGEGGVGLMVERELKLDEALQITLPLPSGESLQLEGFPVSIKPLPSPGWSSVGVRFSRLSPEVRAKLVGLLKGMYRR